MMMMMMMMMDKKSLSKMFDGWVARKRRASG